MAEKEEGRVQTIAGNGEAGFADGAGSSAKLNCPSDAVLSSDGSTLFVADFINHRIRSIDLATSGVSTIAGGGSGYTDGITTSALRNRSDGLCLSENGRCLVFADSQNNMIRRIDIATGTVTTLAGETEGLADGPRSSARFYKPSGVCCHLSFIYIADSGNHRIRRIDLVTDNVTTVTGGDQGYGDGQLTSAKFSHPNKMALTTDGRILYVAEMGRSQIRQIDLVTESVTTLRWEQCSKDGGAPRLSDFFDNFSMGIALIDDDCTLIVSDSVSSRILCIDVATKTMSTLAGGCGRGFNDGPISSARFSKPSGICIGPSREIYVCDIGNNRIRSVVNVLPSQGKTSPTVATALVIALEDSSFCDSLLTSSDGISVSVHSFMLRLRCPGLVDRVDAVPRTSKKARSSNGASSPSSTEELPIIMVPECTGSTLKLLVHFIYSDCLPELTDIFAALSLIKLASTLGFPSSTRRLVRLCVSFIAPRLSVENVIEALMLSLESNFIPMQYRCFSLLASEKPACALEFSRRLVESLRTHPEALARAISASASGVYWPPPSSEAVLIQEHKLLEDLALLWKRACVVGVVGEVGDEFGCAPDCVVTAGCVSVAAHRFVLSARSMYFKAALSASPTGSYVEGTTARVDLQFPEPCPNLTSIQTLLRFLYVGSITDDGCGDCWSVDAEVALDILYMTQSDDMGYFGIHDNSELRSQALRELLSHVTAANVFPLLRRAMAMGQTVARDRLLDHIVDREAGLFKDRQEWSTAVQETPESCCWWSERDELSMKSMVLCANRPGPW